MSEAGLPGCGVELAAGAAGFEEAAHDFEDFAHFEGFAYPRGDLAFDFFGDAAGDAADEDDGNAGVGRSETSEDGRGTAGRVGTTRDGGEVDECGIEAADEEGALEVASVGDEDGFGAARFEGEFDQGAYGSVVFEDEDARAADAGDQRLLGACAGARFGKGPTKFEAGAASGHDGGRCDGRGDDSRCWDCVARRR